MRAPSMVLAAALAAGCVQCGTPGDGGPIRGESWPEADELFHREARWLGADAAFSIPLGGERIAWLFGDTFVAVTAENLRSASVMVRNTVAVQTGDEPTTAAMDFFWHEGAAGPESFIPEVGDRWYWPQHGVRLGNALVTFWTRLRPTPGIGLGFAAEGWRAAITPDVTGPPDTWETQLFESSTTAPGLVGLVAGAAVSVVEDHVVALAIREPGDHAGFLTRWRPEDLVAGNLDAWEWWSGEAWLPDEQLLAGPARVLDDAGPESSLHYDSPLQRWVHVRSDGFGATTLVVSTAADITGPWSQPLVAFRPPESRRPDAFVYAGKGHPELRGADLVVTYAANTTDDFSVLVNDMSLYYPRFVRLSFADDF